VGWQVGLRQNRGENANRDRSPTCGSRHYSLNCCRSFCSLSTSTPDNRNDDDEGRAFADIALESLGAAMFVDHDVACNRQSLSAAPSDFLGGEEGVENAIPDFRADTAAGVRDFDAYLVALVERAHDDSAPVYLPMPDGPAMSASRGAPRDVALARSCKAASAASRP